MSRLLKTLDLVVNTRVSWALRPKQRPLIARRTKDKVVELGPTFVKIGQYISTRGDVVPDELVAEFTKLQDDVHSMDYSVIRDIVKDVDYLTHVSQSPLASASLGQVHMARYKDKKCVVKVLRPYVVDQIESDVRNLMFIAEIFKLFNPTGSDDIIMFVKELESALKMETNYKKEARNTRLFRKNFVDTDWIVVPDVYYATENVLVMEYIPSTKITEVKGVDKKSLAWALTKSQIMQVLTTGFFHGDPHPGNVGVSQGRLVYYDFGMVSQISVKQKRSLIALMIAISNENEDQIIAILNSLGLIGKDPTGIRRFVRFFLDYIRSNKVTDPDTVKDILDNGNNPIKFSGSFFYLVRSFALIEGVSKTLDPSYSSGKLLQRYVDESDVVEEAMVASLENTFSDITGFSYRLSIIEKRVKRQQKIYTDTTNIILVILVLILLQSL